MKNVCVNSTVEHMVSLYKCNISLTLIYITHCCFSFIYLFFYFYTILKTLFFLSAYMYML